MGIFPEIRKLAVELDRIMGRDARGRVFLLLVLYALAALWEMAGVALLPLFIAYLAAPEVLRTYLQGVAWPFDTETWLGRDRLPFYAVGLALFYTSKNLFIAGTTWLGARVLGRLQARTSHRMFAAYLRAPYAFHLERNSSQMTQMLSVEIPRMFMSVIVPLCNLCAELMVLVATTALVVAASKVLSLASLGILGILCFLFFFLLRHRIRTINRRQVLHGQQTMKILQDALGGFREVKMLGCEDHFAGRYADACGPYALLLRMSTAIQTLPRQLVETIMVAGLCLLLWLAHLWNHDIHLLIPGLAVLGMASLRIMPAMNRLSQASAMILLNRASVHETARCLDDLEQAARLAPVQSAGQVLPVPFPGLVLSEVCFTYPGQSRPAVDRVSFVIGPGEMVGLGGRSGAGKSTVADLLLCLLEPTGGTITVGGHPIHTHAREWQSRVGYVPQSIFLADAPIRENVAFGIDRARIDDAAVWKVLETARMGDVVRALPDGLDTWLGERGVRLSGGQRQRIGLARALYRNPEILVLDEATSALDTETEDEIVRLLGTLRGRITTVVIAHRPGTLQRCDRVAFLEDGRLVGFAAPDELARTEPKFRKILALEGDPAS
jgi:ATP-binding cassette subfamily C protein